MPTDHEGFHKLPWDACPASVQQAVAELNSRLSHADLTKASILCATSAYFWWHGMTGVRESECGECQQWYGTADEGRNRKGQAGARYHRLLQEALQIL